MLRRITYRDAKMFGVKINQLELEVGNLLLVLFEAEIKDAFITISYLVIQTKMLLSRRCLVLSR